MAAIREQDLAAGEIAFFSWREQALGEVAQLAAASGSGDGAAANATGSEPFGIPAQLRLQIAPNLDRKTMAMAVRYSLHALEKRAPGPGVEVRVAPFAAVKILEGPASDPHNLTPPDVIELDPPVWLRLATGVTTWAEEKEAGHIAAVGERDDLTPLLPLIAPNDEA